MPLHVSGVVLLTVLGLIGRSSGFRLVPCESTTGADVSSSVCQNVPAGTYCPPNFYCPLYQANQIATYGQVLLESGCSYGAVVSQLTHNASYQVLCPCTPGFYCPANTELPTFCPAGNYCPPSANSTVTPLGKPVGPEGLGAFGSLVFQCPRGTWCPAGQVVPFECNKALSDCPAGSVDPNKTKNWVLLGFIVAFIFLLFQVSEHIASRERRLQDLGVVADDHRRLEQGHDSEGLGQGQGQQLSQAGKDKSGGSAAVHTDIMYAASSLRSPLMDVAEACDGEARVAVAGEGQPAFHIAFEDISLSLPSKVRRTRVHRVPP